MNASTLHALWQSPWLEQVGWSLLHFLWQGTLAAAALALVLAGLHGASARTRYLVSVMGAAAACLLPLLTFLILPLPAGPRPTASLGREVPRPPASHALIQGVSPMAAPWPLPAATAAAKPLVSRQPVHGAVAPDFRQAYHTVAGRAKPLLPWCAALWAVGVAVLSLRLLAGWTQVQQLRRRGTVPADGHWQARLEVLARRLGIRRAVRLLESTLAEVPAVVGWLRPVILLPVGMLTGLSTAQVEMILAHELAHIRRQDYLVNLGLTLFETFGFYHPAVWWIARCVRAEREHACDDLAVSACGGDRLSYVRALATLEELRGPAGQFALAASGGGRGLLLARVRRLLGVTPARRPRSGRATWWLAGVIALLAAFAITSGGIQRPAQAQETSRKQPPAKEQLRGRVVDENGKPVPGALVYDEAANDNMDPGLKEPVLSGADGSFQVPKLRFGGQWRVIAARLGDDALGWLDIGRGLAPAAAGADNVITEPIVLRERRYRLYGVCVDERGQPVAGAQVAVTNLPSKGGGGFTLTPDRPEKTITRFFDALTAHADAQGAFSLTVPVDGGISVEISAPGRQTVYPFSTRRAGVAETGDLGRITLTNAGAIAGRVGFAEGSGGKRSLKGMILNAVEAGELRTAPFFGPPEHTNTIFSDGAGNYRIEHLPPGTYTVYLLGIDGQSATDTPTTVIATENAVVRAGETTPLDLRAVVGRKLTVQAFDADTNRPLGGRPGVHIEGPSEPHSAGLHHGAALTDQGEWWFDVAPGHYRVFLTGDITKGSPELASAEVEVPADHAPEPVRLNVTDHQLRLHGRVQDAQGKPVALGGTTDVLLFETGLKSGYPIGGTMSSDGTFEFVCPRAGVHARVAVDVSGYRLWLSPDFVVTDKPDPVVATLEENETAAATVRGRVWGPDGKPLARAGVVGKMIIDGSMTYQVRLGSGVPSTHLSTDQDGWFETRRFRVGDQFRLFADALDPAVSASSNPMRIERGGTTEVYLNAKFRPRPPMGDVPIGPQDLAGHVVDALGKPIDGAIVTLDGTYPVLAPATTNAQGGFRFVDFGDRHYVALVVEKAGYGTRLVTDLTVGHDFTVRVEDSTRLRGKLLKPDGTPTGPATIVLLANKTTRRPNMNVSGYRLDRKTDEQGAYDFPVEPGEYRIEVMADHDNLVARHEKFEVPAERATALPEALQPGLILRIQTVDGATGQPAPGARFYAREYRSDEIGPRIGSERQTDAQGFAQWDHLFPGPMFLDVNQDPTYGRFWSTDEREHGHRNALKSPHPIGNQADDGSLFIDVLPGRSDDPVVVQTEHGVKISGRVLDPQGNALGGVPLHVIMSYPGDKPGEEMVYGLTGFPNGKVSAADGSFHDWCIPAGNGGMTRLVAEDSESQTLGNGHSEPFPSVPGDEHEVTVRLTTGGWIEGSIVDAQGKPLADTPVVAAVLDQLDGYANHLGPKTDAQGHFHIGPLRPAEYEVRARGANFDWNHPEPPEERRRVAVRAGETVQADPLHFDPAGWTAPSTPLPDKTSSPTPTPAPKSVAGVAPNASPSPAAAMLTAFVKIVDEDGKPIAGVKITPDGLRTRAEPGSHYPWRSDRYGPPVPAVTDASGIAAVRYPRYTDEDLVTGAISFQAEHPDYCPTRPLNYAVVDDPAKAELVVLRRAATLKVAGHLPGSDDAVPVFPQQDDSTHDGLPHDAWREVGGNVLETSQLPSGRNYVRLAHAAADGTMFFSDTTLLSALPGNTYTLDLELKLGVRVEGRLDASVPRPVRGGRVVVHAYATGPEKDVNWVGWDSWRDVAADGTFVFESLPPGELEVTALCDGYTSTNLPDPRPNSALPVPQRFGLINGQITNVEIKMQAAATCTVDVRDAAGAPVAGAQVSLWPNVHWFPGYSSVFCLLNLKEEEMVPRWREYKSPANWLVNQPFQAISDARGIATVRNLPPGKGVALSVIDERYKSFPATVRAQGSIVDLISGETTTAKVQLEKNNPLRPPEKEADAPVPEPSPHSSVVLAAPSHTSPKMDTPSMNAGTPTPASASAATDPAAARTLVFHVVERDTKKPVPDAELRILRDNPEGEQPARTNAEGVCVIPLSEMPRQYLSVRVKKPGFVPMRVDWHCTQPTFQLPAEYTMPLEPGTTIGGTVLNEEGQPVANATVLLVLRGSNMGGKIEEVFPDIWEERVTTDAQGKWTYSAAPSVFRYPGITVEHPDYVRQDYSGPDGPPSVENLRAGTATIRLRRGVRVEGTVTDVTGKAIANAVILPGTDRSGSNTKPEYHTDAEGRFVIPHALPGGQAVLTVVAEGYAPEVVETSFSSAMNPLRVTLPPGQTLRLRVVDTAGQPLAGVLAVTDTWRKRRTLDICLRSDAAGRIEWKSAPADAVEYDFLKEGFQAARNVPLTAAAQEQTVTLRQPLLVSGAITDARTHQPVREFRVITGLATPEGWCSWARYVAQPGHDGHYVQAFDEPAALNGRHLLRVEAEGYRSAVSRQIDDAEGHVALDFSLEPGGPVSGRVLTPEGTPAAGAKIALSFSPGRPVTVQDGAVRHDADQVEATADAQGRFDFPTQEPPYLLVITHPTGYATLTAEEFAAIPDAHLAAWGRVIAAVSPSDLPTAGRPTPYYLTARPPDDPRPASEQPLVYFDAKPKVEADGTTIVFEKVCAGDWWLGRYGQANRNALPVQVHPGETTRAALPRSRSVVGRLNIAAVRDSVDLTQCQLRLSLKVPPLPVPTELAVDERQAWYNQWATTDAGKAYQAALRSYMGEVGADGSFRCDGVPVGKEYKLHIVLLKPGEDLFHPKLIFNFSKDFLLPDGQGVYDLGTAEVKRP